MGYKVAVQSITINDPLNYVKAMEDYIKLAGITTELIDGVSFVDIDNLKCIESINLDAISNPEGFNQGDSNFFNCLLKRNLTSSNASGSAIQATLPLSIDGENIVIILPGTIPQMRERVLLTDRSGEFDFIRSSDQIKIADQIINTKTDGVVPLRGIIEMVGAGGGGSGGAMTNYFDPEYRPGGGSGSALIAIVDLTDLKALVLGEPGVGGSGSNDGASGQFSYVENSKGKLGVGGGGGGRFSKSAMPGSGGQLGASDIKSYILANVNGLDGAAGGTNSSTGFYDSSISRDIKLDPLYSNSTYTWILETAGGSSSGMSGGGAPSILADGGSATSGYGEDGYKGSGGAGGYASGTGMNTKGGTGGHPCFQLFY